jgi:formamidase
VVDIPNACATLWLPTDIFEFDVMPNAAGPIRHIKKGGVDIPTSPDREPAGFFSRMLGRGKAS